MINQQTKSSLNNRVIRFSEMQPCTTAFIDARTPGSDKKENFCLIGQGVTENPGQIVHIDIPHGFNVGAARQPKGCKNSHHSHDTEEVFMIHKGDWQFTWGESGQDGDIILHAGDVISIPTNMFRGFENVGDDDAFMFSILGLNSDGTAGHVLWAPYVFEQAKKYGLVLLEDGQLIDTAVGEKVPDGGIELSGTSHDQVESLDILTAKQMRACVVRSEEISEMNSGGLSTVTGVREVALIGVENSAENIGHGKISVPHGFHLRLLTFEIDAVIPYHSRLEEEVLIVDSGQISIRIDDQEISLNSGDVFTIPIGHGRKITNSGGCASKVYAIRRGDHPSAANFT